MSQDHAFLCQNGRGLGDLAQDMIIVGDKLFISVSESNTIEVVDVLSGKSIKQINMGNRYPRYLASDGNKLYVSCYTPHSVVRIDINSYTIDGTCELTDCMQPEQLCILNNKLYVCSSWQSSSNGAYEYDNHIAVVDLLSFSMIDRIPVGFNPNRIRTTNNNTLIVSYMGDYDTKPSGCALVNVNSREIRNLPVALANFDMINDNQVIGYSTDYDETWNSVTSFFMVNLSTLTSTPILSNYAFKNPYGIFVSPDGNILVCDGPYGSTGDIACFNPDGTEMKWKVGSNLYPSKILWIPSL